MITIIKKLKLKKKDRLNPRTNGKSKAVQTKSHTEACTYTLTKGEKGKKLYIYIYLYIKKLKRERATKSINKFTNDNKL